jgi:hypothetical protein
MDSPHPAPDPSHEPSARQPYTPPQLVVHGPIQAVTRIQADSFSGVVDG